MASANFHDIVIERSNNEKIPVERVPEWEVELLRALHGDDRVQASEAYEDNYELGPIDEYERLKRKYNRKDEGQREIVQRVLSPNVRGLAEQMGVKLAAGTEKKALPKSQNVDQRKKPAKNPAGDKKD